MKTYPLKTTAGALCALTLALISGCASPGKNTIPPAGDMSMAQIYYRETGLSSATDAGNPQANAGDEDALKAARNNLAAQGSDSVYQGEGAKDLNDLNFQFKTLPNPQILVYVSPHLVSTVNGSVPVPGYVTSYFLYPQTEFAMPNEHY
jgi:conjugative transfer region lipoprotein (TIGR03751 family)